MCVAHTLEAVGGESGGSGVKGFKAAGFFGGTAGGGAKTRRAGSLSEARGKAFFRQGVAGCNPPGRVVEDLEGLERGRGSFTHASLAIRNMRRSGDDAIKIGGRLRDRKPTLLAEQMAMERS
jgi:hypothetical protein